MRKYVANSYVLCSVQYKDWSAVVKADTIVKLTLLSGDQVIVIIR